MVKRRDKRRNKRRRRKNDDLEIEQEREQEVTEIDNNDNDEIIQVDIIPDHTQNHQENHYHKISTTKSHSFSQIKRKRRKERFLGRMKMRWLIMRWLMKMRW